MHQVDFALLKSRTSITKFYDRLQLIVLKIEPSSDYLWYHCIRFSDLTGTDYSEAAVDLARSLSHRDGFPSIKFLVRTRISIFIFSFSCSHALDAGAI